MKRPSLRKAIDGQCRACIYDKYQAGTWREQVQACSCPSCPLFPVRPATMGVRDSAVIAKKNTQTEASTQQPTPMYSLQEKQPEQSKKKVLTGVGDVGRSLRV